MRTHRPIAPAIPSRSHSAKTLGAAQGQWTPTATVNVPGSTVNVVVSPLSTQPGVLAKTGAKVGSLPEAMLRVVLVGGGTVMT